MSASRWRGTVWLALLALGLTSACVDDPTVARHPPPLPTAMPSGVGLSPHVDDVTVLVQGLRAPWGIAFLPDGGALVTERDTQRILKVGPGSTGGRPTVTQVAVIDEANSQGEGGLMGIAVSPRYATDQLIFLYYTADNDNRIARWTIGSRPEPIVTGIPISGIHNGGRLAFGPDGYLYATTGDAATRGRSQDLKSLGGKILRMNLDGTPAPGNPFGTLIWSYGHRNVQGIAWDSGNHLWATEFGQNTWDEINRIEPGKNYGWPEVEGAAGDARFVDPVVAWHTDEASCSGAAILGDVLAAACLRGKRLWLMPVSHDGMLAGQPVADLVGKYGRLRAAAPAPDGTLWVLTSNHDGRGEPTADDDRILRVSLRKAPTAGVSSG